MILQIKYSILRLLDELVFVKLMNFNQYFAFHQAIRFPLKKMAFLLTQGYKLNLDNPITFNEKVVHRHLFERNPLLSEIVDKYKVREYVKDKIGEEYLIPLLQIVDRFDEIEFSKLPNEYIIKMSHSSGENIIFKNGTNHLGYDQNQLKKTINTWLIHKYRFQQLIWFVQPIKRRIIIEELLINEHGNTPKDYKFFVFDGKVEFIQVDQERFSNHTQNFYDKSWKRTDFRRRSELGELDEKPITLEEMITLAERLGSDFTFMRVDFFAIGREIYFGELTPCPGGGAVTFNPHEFDEYYGKKWKNNAELLREGGKNE